MKRFFLTLVVLAAIGAAGIFLGPARGAELVPYLGGVRPWPERLSPPHIREEAVALPPAVSVVKAAQADFTEMVTVSGSLVPRDEILVAPEVEGFRVLELKVDEGDRVKKGDVLAILVQESLDAQLAQKEAMLARWEAAISQIAKARSST